MASLTRVPLAILLVLTSVAVSCGKKDSQSSSSTGPTGPTSPTPTGGGNVCRTYPTRANVHTTNSASSITFDAIETGAFDTSTRKATVQSNFANGSPCSTNVISYNSVADFVDEVRVVPPVSLATTAVNTNSGACGSVTATTGYMYDGQRRVTQLTNGSGGTTTYTSWDGSGRPTAGTTSGGATMTLAYDDGARTLTTIENPPGGAQAVSTISFDANGAQTKIVVIQAGITSTTTFTNTSTATVCK